MEYVRILRILARHRVVVAAGALVAILVFFAIAFQMTLLPPSITSRPHSVPTTASMRVLIESPRDRAADVNSELASTLGTRAQLLADLMMDDELHRRLAVYARMREDTFIVLGPSTDQPPVPVTTAVSSADAARVPLAPYVLAISADGETAIITLRVTGFDPAGEVRLADAAAKSLSDLVTNRPGREQALSARRLGPAQIVAHPASSKTIVAVLAAMVVFLVWCTALIVVPGLLRLLELTPRLRRVSRRAAAEAPGR